ncbi:subtilisin-like protease SBT5.3 [Eucalyptus grandis]|uniref:subtilisin-like protease SBT5.3 n=1 Tax=Eucalyptus grandis TaxID=71139 RepID=UPI00192ECE67|nr:subtilisin-like protease SBT5.3 [Eucalyptus grandis]
MTLSVHLLVLFLLSLTQHQTPAFAAKRSYVVYLGSHSHGPDASLADLSRVTESHHEFLGSFLGSRDDAKEAIFYSYTRHINGFAATFEDEVAAQIAKHPRVVSVFLNQGKKLHTTRSWEFLGLEQNGVISSESIWKKARFGEDAIIGNLDTGVWPESKSFSDQGLGPIPPKWKGICQNDKDPRFRCNRKLIGARYFKGGYAAVVGPLNASFDAPRDNNGHGSHTLSTAGGHFVAGASIFGYGRGTAKGGSPGARVATYKVCWPPVAGTECFDADILAGFDAAIHDGVDVLSVSLGSDPSPLFNNSIAIGSFHAVRNGVVVVCSAGNAGPSEGTVSNISPWLITVAASTMDRDFSNYVVIGDQSRFKGASLSPKSLPRGKFYKLISAADARLSHVSANEALLCKNGTLDPRKVKGKILVCLRGDNARVDKGEQALLASAVGMVLANNLVSGSEILSDPHFLPASHVNYTDGAAIFSYINSTKFPTAQITRVVTNLGVKPSPFMAAFSSKGPNTIIPEILKPDVTAPGVSVIAAYTEAAGPTDQAYDKRRVPYNAMSGTSMSCPHVSGVAGLLKTLHPEWSPAAIRSAIMTSATILDNAMESIMNNSFYKATPFSYGAGHIQPNRAMDPGLVYDLGIIDYLNFLCSLGYNAMQISNVTDGAYDCSKRIGLLDFNYPSITVPKLSRSITVTRTVKNVGFPGTYRASILEPNGVLVLVKPAYLKFKKIGEEKSFKVMLKVKGAGATEDYSFGELIWSDTEHHVRSPIVVKAILTRNSKMGLYLFIHSTVIFRQFAQDGVCPRGTVCPNGMCIQEAPIA